MGFQSARLVPPYLRQAPLRQPGVPAAGPRDGLFMQCAAGLHQTFEDPKLCSVHRGRSEAMSIVNGNDIRSSPEGTPQRFAAVESATSRDVLEGKIRIFEVAAGHIEVGLREKPHGTDAALGCEDARQAAFAHAGPFGK
jgi:hypothetical protein